MPFIKKFIKKLNNKKYANNILIIVVFGIILVIAGGQFVEKDDLNIKKNNYKNENEVKDHVDKADYKETIEEKLEKILSDIEGAGKVSVMITYKSGEEIIPAKNINDSETKTEEKDDRGGVREVIQKEKNDEVLIVRGTQGDEHPIILKKNNPQISGIVVTAEGGNNPKVKLNMQMAVKALFDLPSHRIVILKKEI